MVSRVVVGAHYGLKDWLGQRITAVIIAAYHHGTPETPAERNEAVIAEATRRALTELGRA